MLEIAINSGFTLATSETGLVSFSKAVEKLIT